MHRSNQGRRARHLPAILVAGVLGITAAVCSLAQTPEGVVPITSEPGHKIRFDNGQVRLYEVQLPKGQATLVHEHRADSFAVFFRAAEVTNEPREGTPVVQVRTPGEVGFTSTARGPYSHRVVASGDSAFHVIAMELLSPTPGGPATTTLRTGPAFKVVLDNPRGRAYGISLAPGESTGAFTRPAGSVLFAISAGRIRETVDGTSARLWDFEPADFRWFDTGAEVSMKNEGAAPVRLVDIEVF